MLKDFDEDELLDTEMDDHELKLDSSGFAETDERLFGDEELEEPADRPDLDGKERAEEMIQETEAKIDRHLDARRPQREDSEVLNEMKERLKTEFSFDLGEDDGIDRFE